MAKLPATCTAGRWENTATDAKFRLAGPKMTRIIRNVFPHKFCMYFKGLRNWRRGQ